MFFSIFRDHPKPPRQRRPPLVRLSRNDDALIDAFTQVALEWELCFNEVRILLGAAHLEAGACRSLNAKERSPSDEERERMSMLSAIARMLRSYFSCKAAEASDRKQRKFWSNMDSKKFLQQYKPEHASSIAWDMLMTGKLEDIRAIEEAVRLGTQEKK